MKLEAISKEKKLRLIIELDESVGYYLYVYPGNSDISVADHLCDELDEAFVEAEERYQISKNEFHEI